MEKYVKDEEFAKGDYYKVVAFRSRKDWKLGGKPLQFGFCDSWHNNGNSKEAMKFFLIGVANGLRCKYSHPFALLCFCHGDDVRILDEVCAGC